MTRDEFNDWFADYALRFPSTAAWLEEKTQTAQVLSRWFEVLADHCHADCLEASRQVQAGYHEIGSWQDTPQVIARVARLIAFTRDNESLKRETADLSGYRIQCRECRDGGLIRCWDTRTMQAARKELLRQTAVTRWKTAGLPCTCSRGDRFAKWAVHNGGKVEIHERIRYDATKWVRLTGDDAVDQQALRDWAVAYKPANYSDFGEYGEF